MIKAIYTNPRFCVRQKDAKSDWKCQRTGIRQGCPLSPYLFILTMFVMFEDVKTKYNDPHNRRTFEGININELLYADDTLIIAKNARNARKYLHIIEDESTYLHLALNHGKCNYISYHNQGTINFKDGTPMTKTEQATYLGATISKHSNAETEVRKRITATMPILKKLDTFWCKAECNQKWKLLVFNAVIVSKLLYGLETIEPNNSVNNLIDIFQLKGLRKILKLKTTYIDRINTNHIVYEKANEAVGSVTSGEERKIKPLTETLEKRKIKLLGHILRREREHPQHQITFSNNNALPRETRSRRVGKPRKFWTRENMRKAWERIQTSDSINPLIPFNRFDATQRSTIIQRAKNYETPFD
jgi:hypothetical protein